MASREEKLMGATSKREGRERVEREPRRCLWGGGVPTGFYLLRLVAFYLRGEETHRHLNPRKRGRPRIRILSGLTSTPPHARHQPPPFGPPTPTPPPLAPQRHSPSVSRFTTTTLGSPLPSFLRVNTYKPGAWLPPLPFR